jgi:hypothetical protein
MLFRSKENRQAERKNEFTEFLRSAEGRRAIFELAPDILVSGKLSPILNNIRAQLELLTSAEIERFKLLLANALGTAEVRFADTIAQFEQQLDRTLKATEDQFTDFLRSQEGKRLMLNLLIEALGKGELTPVLDGAEKRLKVLAKEMVATHMARAELSLRQSAEAHAAAFKRSASEAARDLANQVAHDVEQQLSSYRGAMAEAVQEQLPVALREEVSRHVRSGPLFSPPCSNRTLAAAHGISIREVKRRRRYGLF